MQIKKCVYIMKNFFTTIDDSLNDFYEKMHKSFFGKIFIKLSSEIILALLISIAVYCGTSFYENSKVEAVENEKLNKIYISVSNDYIESLFGKPYVSVSENETLQSNFFLLDNAILRTVSEKETVVAYFITSKNHHRKLIIKSIESNQNIGKVTYSKIDFPNSYPKAFFCGMSCDNYYAELQATGRYAMYNHYVFATLPYGFIDNESMLLCQSYSIENYEMEESVEFLRKKATPNTFGVIANGYEKTVSIIPTTDMWIDIYYILTK